MRFLLDEQLPPALAKWMVKQGKEADHVARLKLLGAVDPEIAHFAVRKGYVLVSKDADFSDLLREEPSLRVLWLRVGNLSNRELLARLEEVWSEVIARFEAGETIVPVDPAPPSP